MGVVEGLCTRLSFGVFGAKVVPDIGEAFVRFRVFRLGVAKYLLVVF